jgi:Protein of unknown function (DUF2631)
VLCNDVAFPRERTEQQSEEVGVARNSRELAERPAVDPHDEPSAEWGWHGSFPRAKIIAGVFTILLLIAFIFGPYQSRTQDLWLIGLALGIAFMIWRQVVNQRNSWRR